MRNFTGNGYGNAPRNSRELLMARLSKSFPDRSFDDENLFFDSLLEYEEDMRKRYYYLCQDQMKLADIFMANPRMAEFIGDVLGGDDALAACVRHFGKDILECVGDERKLEDLERENEEFTRRVRAGEQLRREMEENWQHSARAIARFKAHKGMSDEEFEDFLDRVHHVCEHVFMHDFTTEILELLFKGINYDLDMDNTERIAEIRGRNERILSERKQRDGNILPHLGGNGGGDDADENRSAAFGFRRRRSVWDM